jgi:hypothetical protein
VCDNPSVEPNQKTGGEGKSARHPELEEEVFIPGRMIGTSNALLVITVSALPPPLQYPINTH